MTPPIVQGTAIQEIKPPTPSQNPRIPELIGTIRAYSEGILSEDLRHSGATLDANAPLKSLTNVIGFLPLVIRLGLTGNKNYLWGNQLAAEKAKEDFDVRKTAIDELESHLNQGISKISDGVSLAELKSTLLGLSPRAQDILNNELGVMNLHGLLSEGDLKTRYQKMFDFAQQDRPHFLGFGGGNTHKGWFKNKWNLSGHRYNPYFSRTLLNFLLVKARTGDSAFDQLIKEKARVSLVDSTGEGTGGFINLIARGITLTLCTPVNLVSGGKLGKTETCVTPYRDWSDEDTQDGLGRAILGAAAFIQVNRLMRSLENPSPFIQRAYKGSGILKRTPKFGIFYKGLFGSVGAQVTEGVLSTRYIPEAHQLETRNSQTEFERYPTP